MYAYSGEITNQSFGIFRHNRRNDGLSTIVNHVLRLVLMYGSEDLGSVEARMILVHRGILFNSDYNSAALEF